MKISWHGVFPAVCTQFHNDYSLNILATLAHIDAQLAAGIHGLVMMGSVGENTTLEPGEKRELLKATVAHVRKKVPVLVGVAEYTTAQACRWAVEARADSLEQGLWLDCNLLRQMAAQAPCWSRPVRVQGVLDVLRDHISGGCGIRTHEDASTP